MSSLTAADGLLDPLVDLVPLTDGRYQLHPVFLDTDYRRFIAALSRATHEVKAQVRERSTPALPMKGKKS